MGIVTVNDGQINTLAGPAIIVPQVFNAMWNNAQEMLRNADMRTNQAMVVVDPSPRIGPLTPLNKDVNLPPRPNLPTLDPRDAEALYNSSRADIERMIVDGFRNFILEHFPHPEFYDDALLWCDRAVVEGGTGINPDVERQMWERDRTRFTSEMLGAEADAQSTWARQRFPLPPGALTAQINQIRLEAAAKLAQQSREIAIKSFEAEIENVRFAVGKLLDLRKIALDAAGDYIRTLVTGPQTAVQLALGLTNMRSEMARALTSLYQAEVAALDPAIRLAITDAQLREQAEEANLRAASATQDAKVRAALAGAQTAASMASAGINAIHAGATISGSSSESVTTSN